jgi:hypothetical protein
MYRTERRTVLAALALLLASCGFEVALNKGIDPATVQDRAQWISAQGMTRKELIERIGEPWISDTRRRVDVFRISKTERRAVIVLAPYPIPVPAFSRDFLGYSLVVYREDGTVDAADSAFTVKEGLGVSDRSMAGYKSVAEAGDYTFTHTGTGPADSTLTVTYAGYVRDRAADADAAAMCTLIAVCDSTRSSPDAAASSGICWQRLRVDGADVGQVVSLDLLGPVWQYASVPVRLAPGSHHLSYTNPVYRGSAEGTLDCAAGELWYASFRGTVLRSDSTLGEQLRHGLVLGEASPQLVLAREPPQDRARPVLLLHYGGKPVNGRGLDR